MQPALKGVYDCGRDYQIELVTYLAAILSKNEFIEDYTIVIEPKIIKLFEDIVVKVKFRHPNSQIHIYLVQVKHRQSVDIDFDKARHKLNDYAKAFSRIISTKNEDVLKFFEGGRLHFWYFCNREVHIEGYKLKRDQLTYASILDDEVTQNCYKLTPGNVFLNNFYLFLNQPDHQEICNNIQKLLKLPKEPVKHLIMYIDHYFRGLNGFPSQLTKRHFDTQTLKLHLSDFVVTPPTKIFEMNTNLAEIWNKLTLHYDITLINNVTSIKYCIFGCLQEQIRKVIPDFEWSEDINKFQTTFQNLVTRENQKEGGIKTYWVIPDTLKTLIEELWRLNKLPLILRTGSSLSTLIDYKHLGKKIIIVGEMAEKDEENLRLAGYKIFKNSSNLTNTGNNTLTHKINISFQGRKPTSLHSVIANHQNARQQINCSQLLNLMKKREVFLRKECLFKLELTVFVIEDKIARQKWEFIKDDNCKVKNIKIICNSLEEFKMETRMRYKFDNFSFCYLRLVDEMFKFVDGDGYKLRHFLIDKDGQDVYVDENNIVVPVIGERLGTSDCMPKRFHIKRHLFKTMLTTTYFEQETNTTYYIYGNKDLLNAQLQNTEKFDIAQTGNTFKFIENDSIEKYWSDSDLKVNKKMCIKIVDGGMELLKHENCEHLETYTSYGEPFYEDLLFEEINSKSIMIIGEAGMGKSTLLHSLSEDYPSENYVLFYDLSNLAEDMRNLSPKLLKDPLQFIFNKTKNNIFQNFIESIYNFHKKEGSLVLFLDSLDQILPIAQVEVLEFIKSIQKTNIKIISSSRSAFDHSLLDKFGAQLLKIGSIKDLKDRKDYLKFHFHDSIEINIKNIPEELLKNPLHLSFLNCALTNKFDSYKNVLEKKVDWYCNKYRLQYFKESALEYCKLLALTAVFDKDTINNQGIKIDYEKLIEKCKLWKIKLGIIKSIDKPEFIRKPFAYYLAMEWVKENIEKDGGAQGIYKELMIQNNLDVRYFLDNTICRTLSLHKAVLNEEIDQINILCKNVDINLNNIDNCNRTPLYLACSYCTSDDNENIFYIIYVIVTHMLARRCAFDTRDKYLEWNWIQCLTHKKSKALVKNFSYLGFDNLNIYSNGAEYTNVEEFHFLNVFVMIFMLYTKGFSLISKYPVEVFRRPLDIINKERSTIFCEVFNELNTLCDTGITSLHIQSACGNFKEMNNLITNHGIDVNAQDKFGRTPLHYSAVEGSKIGASLLIENGSNICAKDNNNDTPLHLALRLFKEDDIINLFLNAAMENRENQNGESLLDITNNDGDSVFHTAARNGNTNVLNLLLENGANIEQPNLRQDTALHLVCEGGHVQASEVIITKIVSMKCTNLLSVKNKRGQTPLDIACTEAKDAIIVSLINQGIDIAELDSFGHILLECKRVKEYLISRRSLTNNNHTDLRKSLIDWVIKIGHTKCLSILLKGEVDVCDIEEL